MNHNTYFEMNWNLRKIKLNSYFQTFEFTEIEQKIDLNQQKRN